jgi:hypothetical protein
MRAGLRLVYILTATLTWSDVSGQERPEQLLSDRLETFSSFIQPQKVYLHFDKTSYYAGETIWFKSYLFSGVTHLLAEQQSNLYVEMINTSGEPVDMRILLVEDGVAAGEIELREGLPDGNYMIKAYTDWMKNFSEDLYFTQHLYIENSDYENVIPRREVRRNRRFNRNLERMEDNYEVAFFPESGNIVEGITNRVAFRVVDDLGNGKEAGLEITDGRGNIISTATSDFSGIGVFEFNPENGTTYDARLSVNGGSPQNFDLPEIMAEGYTLRIDHEDGLININLGSRVSPNNELYSRELYLIGHTRGHPRFVQAVEPADDIMELTVDESLFPAGIAHFTLFTENFRPVAERLIFINGGDELYFDTKVGVVKIDGRDHIDLNMKIINADKDIINGSFSLSAVTGIGDTHMHTNDIMSYLLLDSDLKGMVENPLHYIFPKSDQEVTADHLLMTYGWRRFKWENVIAEEFPEIRYEPLAGLYLTGKLLDPAKDESLNNYPVRLEVKSGHNNVYTTNTMRNGNFVFDGLNYKGTFDIELSSRRLPGNYPPVMELHIDDGRDFEYEPGLFTRDQRITERGKDWERVRGLSRTNTGNLNERAVSPQLYGVPDQTIFIDHETSVERSLFDVLRNRATGLSFDGNQILIRGPSSFYLNNEPRFMVDGMFVTRDVFLNLYPGDVERIEIFRGTRAAIFGVRGGTGVILAYTRKPGYRGFDDVRELVMLGYHTPKEFYSDVMPSGITNGNSRKKTIHWDPDLVSGDDGVVNVRFPVPPGADRIMVTIEGAGFEGGFGFAGFTIDLEK